MPLHQSLSTEGFTGRTATGVTDTSVCSGLAHGQEQSSQIVTDGEIYQEKSTLDGKLTSTVLKLNKIRNVHFNDLISWMTVIAGSFPSSAITEVTARRRRSAESWLCLQLPLGVGCSVRKGWQLGLQSEEHGWVFLLCFFPLWYEYGNAEEHLLLAQSCHSSLLPASFYMSKKVYVSGRSVPSEIRLMFKMLAALCGNAGSVWRLGGEGWSAPLPRCVSESVQCQAAVARRVSQRLSSWCLGVTGVFGLCWQCSVRSRRLDTSGFNTFKR